MNSRVVYTCIIGGYDNILCHQYVDENWDYILFSDDEELIQKGSIYHWQVKRNEFNSLDNTRNSRYVKINPHLVLPEYEYSFYVDGNVVINHKSIFDKLDDLIKDEELVSIPFHFERDCVYDEAEVIKNIFIDYPKIINQQIQFLQMENYPVRNGLFENCLIFRKHKEQKLINVQNLWWKMVTTYSKRDQLSALYCFWKYGVLIKPLFEDKTYHRNCKEFTFVYKNQKCHDRAIKSFWGTVIDVLAWFIPSSNSKERFRKKIMKVIYK